MMEVRPRFGITGSTLKLIATITMFIDHFGAVVVRQLIRHPYIQASAEYRALWMEIYNYMRKVGRIAFPIYCFLLVEGFIYTRSRRNYFHRLVLFALISELPFDLVLKGNLIYPKKQNVYFTLAIGFLVLMAIEYLTDNCRRNLLMASTAILPGMLLAQQMKTDYNFKGIFMISAIYLFRRDRLDQCISGAIASSWECPAPLAFLPIYFYNGKRGWKLKYFFYFFYPGHLILIYFINMFVQQYLNTLI